MLGEAGDRASVRLEDLVLVPRLFLGLELRVGILADDFVLVDFDPREMVEDGLPIIALVDLDSSGA